MNKYCELFWVLSICLIIGVMCGNPLAICLAMFTFSADGLNAWNYFQMYRKVGK